MRVAVVVLVVLVVLAGGGWLWYRSQYGFRYPPGPVAAAEPAQKDVAKEKKRWKKGDYLITALASFEMTGRVLIAERYWTGREADLSPVDLTLAWGPASDTEVLEKLDIYKLERYYRYEWDDPSVDGDMIARHSANMHMIPANDVVDGMLKAIRREDVVHFRGYLVQCDSPDGWSWTSSLTRDDKGNGACELVWVESLSRR